MANTVWSIAIISAGIVSPVIQQIGYFQDEITCQRSLADLKSQTPVQHKIICVQSLEPPPPAKPPPPPPPSQSVSSKDARK
jgi:hypothetical protein